MNVSLKKYKKDLKYSYASGVFATLELLQHKPELVTRVFISSRGAQNKGLGEIRALCDKRHIPLETADSLVIKLSNSENCYAIGVFRKYESTLSKDADHLLLVNPSDMGNVGTIIRSMVGFDVKNIALIKPCVDIFDPKVIRSSTGAFFQTRYEFFNSIEEYTRKYSNNIYSFMLNGKDNVRDTKFIKPFTLVFGNEGSGLDKKYLNLGKSVTISHSKNIDSLNLSLAVGIALYESRKEHA